MAKDATFDIVSEVNMAEVTNAVNQTEREITQRYDFKGVTSEIALEKDSVKITTADEMHLKSIIDVLQSKFIKRQVPIDNLEYGKIENAGDTLTVGTAGLAQGGQDFPGQPFLKRKGRWLVAAGHEKVKPLLRQKPSLLVPKAGGNRFHQPPFLRNVLNIFKTIPLVVQSLRHILSHEPGFTVPVRDDPDDVLAKHEGHDLVHRKLLFRISMPKTARWFCLSIAQKSTNMSSG